MFQIQVIWNKAATNCFVEALNGHHFISLRWMPRCAICSALWEMYVYFLKKLPNYFSEWFLPFYLPASNVCAVYFLCILTGIWWFYHFLLYLFWLVCSNSLVLVLTRIFVMANGVEYLLLFLFDMCIFSLVEWLFVCFVNTGIVYLFIFTAEFW